MTQNKQLPYRQKIAESLGHLPMACNHISDVMEVDDGWLVGFDSGEWGGTLYWFSKDVQTHCNLGWQFQVVKFFRRSDGIYAIEGMANMSILRGSVIQILKADDGRWKATTVLELPAAPREIIIVKKNDEVILKLKWDDTFFTIYPDWSTCKHFNWASECDRFLFKVSTAIISVVKRLIIPIGIIVALVIIFL